MVLAAKRVARTILPAVVANRLRRMRVGRMIAGFSPRQVEHVYGGHPLRVLLTDPMAQAWYDGDWPVLPEVTELSAHSLKAGATVFDVGAHHGIVAMMLASIVGEQGRVVAVEGDRHNAESCETNRRLNGLMQMTVVHAVASDRSGDAQFLSSLNGRVAAAGERGAVTTPGVSIDDLARRFDPPDVLFIDVEGFECQVLRGARAALARRPDCFVEVHSGAGLETFGSREEVLSFFPPSAYDLFVSPDDIDTRTFERLPEGGALPATRHFLLALARRA